MPGNDIEYKVGAKFTGDSELKRAAAGVDALSRGVASGTGVVAGARNAWGNLALGLGAVSYTHLVARAAQDQQGRKGQAMSYGTIGGVAALVPRFTNAAGVFDTSTTPAAADVTAWLGQISAMLDVALSSYGVEVPIALSLIHI